MAAQVGNLEVRIGINDEPMQQGEKRVNNSVDRMDRRLGSLSTAISGGVTRAFAAFGIAMLGAAVSANQIINRIDSVSDAAVSAGISLEKMSSLTFAAGSEGLQNFDKALLNLYKTMANSDPMSDQALLFSQLGVATRNANGSIRDVDKVLGDLANKFSSFSDGPQKSAIAMRLFGESGSSMIKFLNKGSAGIQQLRNDADRLGGTLSTQTGVVVGEVKDEFNRLGQQAEIAGNRLAVVFGPSIRDIAKALNEFSVSNQVATRAVDALEIVWRGLKTAFEAGLLAIRQFNNALGTLGSAMAALATKGFAAAAEAVKKGMGDAADIATQSMLRMKTHIHGALDSSWSSIVEYANKAPAPIIKSASQINEALQQIRTTNQSNLSDLVGGNFEQPAMKLLFLEEMVKKGSITWREYVEAIKAVNSEVYTALQFDLINDPTVPIAEKISALDAAVKNGTASWHEYKQAIKSVNDQGSAAMNDLMSTTANALTSIFQSNKTAAIASAIINTYQGITKAIANYPPPMSYAMAGLQAAMGFAQVQQIRNTTQSGGGGGGSSVSSSGAATAAAAAQPAAAQQEQTLFVQGIDRKGLFDGETVRHLVGQIVEYQRDGGRIILGGA